MPIILSVLSIALLAAAMIRVAMLSHRAFAIPAHAICRTSTTRPPQQYQLSRIEHAACSPFVAKIYACLFVLSSTTSLILMIWK